MQDSSSVMDMKNSALPRAKSSESSSQGGFKFYHLLIIAVIAMLAGAYVQLTYLRENVVA